MANLFTLWDASNPGLNTCTEARAAGLRCLQKQGTWSTLEDINRPTLIGLLGPGGKKEKAYPSASGNAI